MPLGTPRKLTPAIRESPCVSPDRFGTGWPPQEPPEIPDSTGVRRRFATMPESWFSPPPQAILSQWPASILLGAHNIEQTKPLNGSDLDLLLGTTVRSPAPRRELLGALATTPQTVAAVLRGNFPQLGQPVMRCDVFHLDPTAPPPPPTTRCNSAPTRPDRS